MAKIQASYRFRKLMVFRFSWIEFEPRKRALFDNLSYNVHLRDPKFGLIFFLNVVILNNLKVIIF